MLVAHIASPVMAKREPAREETELTAFRLRGSLLKRIRAYANAHRLQPSLAQIVNAAIDEWLDRHEDELGEEKKPAK
jgi:hypothetical protein